MAWKEWDKTKSDVEKARKADKAKSEMHVAMVIIFIVGFIAGVIVGTAQ